MTHSGEKGYKCFQCLKSYLRPGQLKRHNKTHSGEKGNNCEQCEKSFTQSGDLKLHKITHSGQKGYDCLQCGKSFMKSSDLKNIKGFKVEKSLLTAFTVGSPSPSLVV